MLHAGIDRLHTVLVVEDEPIIRLMIVEELRDAGLQVVETTCADEAWGYLSSGLNVDLIFTDVKMPGTLDGVALVRQVREKFPSIPTILASGHYLEPEALKDSGTACAFVRKPYDLTMVITLIRDHLTAPGKQARH